jgi:hypothetical protein
MPLLMDLQCPVEFCGAEITRDSAGRSQAYLTFFNLSEKGVEGLRAMVTLEDEAGRRLGIRPIIRRDLRAAGRSRFTLGVPLREAEATSARALVHDVWLEGGETFHLDEEALLDCTVCEEPPGEARAALIGVAGEDAVCYARSLAGMWVCICGRYNENARQSCIRCRRSRREVFALTPQRTVEAYQAIRRRESRRLETGRASARQRQERLRERRRKAYLARVAGERRRRWALRLLMGVLLAAVMYWLFR